MNVLSGDRIRELFAALDQELAKRSVVGEVGLLGGAVMCLVFQAREEHEGRRRRVRADAGDPGCGPVGGPYL